MTIDQRHYFKADRAKLIKQLGPQVLIKCLKEMILIRNFEIRSESAYQQGKIGGFFHAYIGQEAIQTSAVQALGLNNWWVTTYRCHALAILLGAPINELMAELYGRATGNAKGRGGSMHFFTETLLGGFGIVGGHIPIATGAAFSIKYLNEKDKIAVCFLGDGAVAQGAFHEALNLASLWKLPCLYVIENNLWGMGTFVEKAICVPRLAEDKAPGYNMKGYSVNGMDFFDCFACFKHIQEEMLKDQRPVLLEAVTERFKGHSISDPGLYRTKDQMKEVLQKDPLLILEHALIEAKILNEEQIKEMDKEARHQVMEAMDYADNSPWPDVSTLEEDVFSEA